MGKPPAPGRPERGPQIAQRGRIEVLEGVDGGKRQPHLARGDADHGGDLEQLEADGGALRLGHGRAGQAHLPHGVHQHVATSRQALRAAHEGSWSRHRHRALRGRETAPRHPACGQPGLGTGRKSGPIPTSHLIRPLRPSRPAVPPL